MGEMCAVSDSSILSVLIKTPLGDYTSKACAKGIHLVHKVDPKGPSVKCDFSVDIRSKEAPKTVVKYSEPENIPPGAALSGMSVQKIVDWFHLYFMDPGNIEKKFPNSIQICVPGATEFQMNIWETLRDNVQFGSTVTYGELAALANKPNAARAVGSAMKRNPNCLVIPCHRVIKSNAEIGNYSSVGGRDIKVWLLEHEKKFVK